MMQSLLVHLILTSFVFLSSVNNVNAGITSIFIRKEWPSVDIPLDNEVFADPTGYNSPQQVRFFFLLSSYFFSARQSLSTYVFVSPICVLNDHLLSLYKNYVMQK